MTEVLFWGSVGVIAYAYIGFPLLVGLRALLAPQSHVTADIEPSVSLLIAAYNEGASIREKLENALALDYPRDRLEILVASDGSTDDTDRIVDSFRSDGVVLLALPRRGKSAALNAAVTRASGEILVFSDATNPYAPDAVRALVRHFADPRVGGVAGNQVYFGEGGDGERGYWAFDRLLKRLQARSTSIVSATGAIYAIRREHFSPVPPGTMDDFVISTSVVAAGARLVYAHDAVAFERVAASTEREFSRKRRNMVQGLRGVIHMRRLLNPFRYGFYAVQLFSHKVLRRLVVFPLIVMLPTSFLLWSEGAVYRVAFITQVVVYGLALAGLRLRRSAFGRAKVFVLPLYFCMVNVAALVAVGKILRGDRLTTWETERPSTGSELTAERWRQP